MVMMLTVEENAMNRDFSMMSRYGRFEDIPPEIVCESSLVAWLCHLGKLSQIPCEMRTAQVLFAAVRHDSAAFESLQENEAVSHRELTLRGVIAGRLRFESVQKEYKDEDFIIGLSAVGAGMLTAIDFAGEYKHLLTDRVVEAICTRRLSAAYEFGWDWFPAGRDRIKDEYIEVAIAKEIFDYDKLKIMGKSHVLTNMLNEGFWPEERQFYPGDSCRVAPKSVSECFEILCEQKYPYVKVLLRCWMQTRPTIEAVEALHGSKTGLDELFSLYPIHEIREHMNGLRSIRGRLLENDLGM